jgi:hypothetical protein
VFYSQVFLEKVSSDQGHSCTDESTKAKKIEGERIDHVEITTKERETKEGPQEIMLNGQKECTQKEDEASPKNEEMHQARIGFSQNPFLQKDLSEKGP